MLIISNALSSKIDEGCLKVANSLVSRIKKKEPDTVIVSYGDKPSIPTIHMKLNKLLLNYEFLKMVKAEKGPVIYLPFSSNTPASVLRTFILSLFAKNKLKVMYVLRHEMNWFFTFLLKKSRAEVITFSKESYNFFKNEVKVDTEYLKTGVDTNKFIPVSDDRKRELREKYNLPTDKKILLHVGHLNKKRNVDKLYSINEDIHVVLVVSHTQDNQETEELQNYILSRPNTTLIDEYIENIEEIYQLADIYFFPTISSEGCIDVPLSVMEAASCNLPVVTTFYGELKELYGKECIYFINSFEEVYLNDKIYSALENEECNSREAVLPYDWDNAVSYFLNKED